MRRRIPWFRALLIGVGVGLLATPASYVVALTVSPTLTPDGHRVMPIAHVGFALVFGAIASVFAAVCVARAGRR
jgi:hypothetical protein